MILKLKSVIFNHPYILLLITLLITGILSRLYLIINLPIWFDENSTLKIINNSFGVILSGKADATHPMGYYLFLKIWSQVSNNTLWLRISTLLFFTANVFLLYKIGTKITNYSRGFSLILIFLYIFSGYFIVFDWQYRMYTGLTTLILTSIYLLSKDTKNGIIGFTIINSLGLYFDYGFLFYFIPLSFYLSIVYFCKKKLRTYFYSTFISLATFSYGILILLRNFNKGLESIQWINNYIKPSFVLPYFFGVHQLSLFVFILFFIILIGMYIMLTNKDKNIILSLLLFCLICSILLTIFFTYLFKPILHVRSLQIVSLSIIFIESITLYKFFVGNKISKFVALVILFYFLINFIDIFQKLQLYPALFMIKFV